MSAKFELNDLLVKSGIDPPTVMVMRHRPTEKELRKALAGLAADRPETYNAYQSIHDETVEASLLRKAWLASFIGHQPGSALFVGMYRVEGCRRISAKEYLRNPANRRLVELGSRPPRPGRTPLWFELKCADLLSEYKGRLVVGWPGIERSWWRRAERNCFPVEAIAEESLLVYRMPDPSDLVLSWARLSVLPSSWDAAISQWRGIYYIFDKASGMGYVGSASGSENMLGRWRNYAASGHGGNKLLKGCKPENLEFSILELLAASTDPKDVLALESKWKERLHTRAPFGLNSN